MNAATVITLQNVVRKQGRSLLQYVSESFPWTTQKNHQVLPILVEMAKEERDGAAAVVKWLVAHRARPPYLGAYPMGFTTINFVSLDFLIPQLINFDKRRIAELDKDLAAISDENARQLVKSLLEVKQRHLATLMSLASPEKPAA